VEKERYVKQCPACENYVEGREMRGIVRQMVHDGPEAIVEWVPVGGKLVWRGTKEVAKLLLKTNMEQWGDNLEKMLYEDIQVKYHCPKCGREWTEKHRLSQLEYRQWIADTIESAKSLLNKQDTSKKKNATPCLTPCDTVNANDEPMTKQLETTAESMRLQIPYSMVEDFVRKRYNQDLTLSYVSEDTIAVSKEVKIIVSKNVAVNVSVLQVTGSDIMLSYQACMGIDLIIKGALSWFKDTVSGMADILNDNKIQIHLHKIPQLGNVLKKVELQGINFEEQYINVLFQITY